MIYNSTIKIVNNGHKNAKIRIPQEIPELKGEGMELSKKDAKNYKRNRPLFDNVRK